MYVSTESASSTPNPPASVTTTHQTAAKEPTRNAAAFGERLVAQHRADVVEIRPDIAANRARLPVNRLFWISYIAEELVADGVVRSEGRGVRRGGLGAAVSTVGLEHHDGLLLRNALHAADELGSVVEALHVGPDLLHGGILLEVVDAVLLVHIARVPERNEPRDPGLLRRAGQLG